MAEMNRIAVLGAGSWGTALASLLARNGKDTVLWGRDAAQIHGMQASRINTRYLPGIELPNSLRYTDSLIEAMQGCDHVLIVVPSHAFAEIAAEIRALRPAHAGVSWATKGFDPSSGQFLHEVAHNVFGDGVPLAVVTGPSFAKEVALNLPTAVTVHSDDAEFAHVVASALHGPSFRAYTGNDVIGAELGGAMKNVLAVATGVADGMQLGLNARAGLITRGMNEMLRLCAAIGGRPETIMGLAGLGDLVLTCTGDLSRNRRLGLALGKGKAISEAVAEIGQVVESIVTVNQVMQLGARCQVELPITEQVSLVLHETISPAVGLRNLLAREQKPEYPHALFASEETRIVV